jgi:hypothetical protein
VHRLLCSVLVALALLAPAASASNQPVQTLQLGGTFTVTGVTGSRPGNLHRVVGPVVVYGRWSAAAWHVLSRTKTDARGHYRFRIKPAHRGTLTLRIVPPDLRTVRYVLHVV